MKSNTTYGNLCSLFYDATKQFASVRELAFYASFMKKTDRVLEAMCGSGRLLIPLMQQGYLVEGVDNSQAMLNRCIERAAAFNISPVIYNQSLESLDVPKRYDVVTIAIGSFQLITDRSLALQSLQKLHEHMQSGGSLLVDVCDVKLGATAACTETVMLDDRSSISLSKEYTIDQTNKIAHSLCTYSLIHNGMVQQVERETISITWYSDVELRGLLEAAGFKVVQTYELFFEQTGLSRIVHAQKV